MVLLIIIALELIMAVELSQQRLAHAPIWAAFLPSLGAITFRGGHVSANSGRRP